MSLSIGIVGLPNVGKSTLFNALTNKSVPADNYPFCTIDPSVGIVAVPDIRLDQLSKLSSSKKTIPAVVEFVDIAGLVKGASEGAGLGNQFLSHIRETDAIAHVVRIYEHADLIHVEGSIDPLRDIQIINMELILADMATVEKRLGNIERDVKRGDKDAMAFKEVLTKVKAHLEEEKLANALSMSEEEERFVHELHLITKKPMLLVLNKQHGGKNIDEMKDARFTSLMDYIQEHHFKYVIVDAKIEDELKEFVGNEKELMRSELGAHDNGINTLITAGFDLLNLEVYFTTGEDETRAWMIQKWSTAPVAAGAIHTDFKDKFIRAEVVKCEDLIREGSYADAQSKGLVRTEGKEYIVQDGDVMEFKI